MRIFLLYFFVLMSSVGFANMSVEDKIANKKFKNWQQNPELLRVLNSVQNHDGTTTLEIPQVFYQGSWFSIFSGFSNGNYVMSDYSHLPTICKAFGFKKHMAMGDVFTVNRGDFREPESFEYVTIKIDPEDQNPIVSNRTKGVFASTSISPSNTYSWSAGQSVANKLNCK